MSEVENDCILVVSGMQVMMKGNKDLTEMILNQRLRRIYIIQCEQCTQSTDFVQKMNADYFILYGKFTLGDCNYFHEKFLSLLNADMIYKLNIYMHKYNVRFIWIDREERVCLGFKKEVIIINVNGDYRKDLWNYKIMIIIIY